MQHYTTVQNRAGRWIAIALTCSNVISAVALRAQAVTPPVESPPAQTDEAVKMMEFFVQEKGVSRATNTITPKDMKVAIPGVNPIKLLQNAPGVNITAGDPFNLNDEGGTVRVRSFNINVVAVTVDDVPMGSNSGRYGTPAGRIVDSENLTAVTVNQGSGDVTTPAFEALGGAIKYYTTTPEKNLGMHLVQTFGQWDYARTFFRVDTGELLPGLTSFISTSKVSFHTKSMPTPTTNDKLDVKFHYVMPKTTLSYSFTWNDFDNIDQARSIQYDRWRAIETGNPFAAYSATRYTAQTQTDLGYFANLRYSSYSSANAPLMTKTLLKNYSDKGREATRRTTLDSSVNLGDSPNDGYYYYGLNGRMDAFSRFIAEHSFTDAITGKLATYYQHKQYYGTAYVPRTTVLGNISSAYKTGSNGAIRQDIWPRYAYRDTAGNLVPYGTPGAIPVGFDDVNKNGIFDPGEKLNAAITPTAFTPTTTYSGGTVGVPGQTGAVTAQGHALITPTSTTLANAVTATPGATSRDEEFGGFRWGFFPQATVTFLNHKLTGGFWYEKDVQNTTRPQYNLFEGSPTGGILYDQVYFNSYTRRFLTESTQIFLQDTTKWFDERLTIILGAKSLTVDRSVAGMIDGSLFFLPLDQQYKRQAATYKDNFLPQVGAAYKLNREFELFANYGVNIAAPTQDVITSLNYDPKLKPEKATNYDLGIRYAGKSFSAGLAFYYNAYEERLLTVPLTIEEQNALGIAGVVGTSIYRNVGGIDSKGAEASFDWATPIKGLQLVGTAAYAKAEFKQNLRVSYQSFMNPDDTVIDPREKFYVPILNPNYIPGSSVAANAKYLLATELNQGKSQGDTPQWVFNLQATYTWKRILTLNFGGRYYDKVFANTMNTEVVPSYTSFDAGFSLRGKRGTKVEPFTLSVQASNVFDQYIFRSGAGTSAFDGSVTADYGRTLAVTVDAKF